MYPERRGAAPIYWFGMSAKVRVSRVAQVPDRVRLEQCLRQPELGPRLLFFSGGTALRAVSEALKGYTHNSIHLITPFDSGGSSAKLRDAFDMLAVGDLRNRLMALADKTVKGSPDVYLLFSYRLDEETDIADLLAELRSMGSGQHALIATLDASVREIVCHHLRIFLANMPGDFDLRGASIGNLILAGGYLASEGDILSVLFLFSRLVEVRGIVRPIVEDSCHLGAQLSEGRSLLGQHRITRVSSEKMAIERLYLIDSHEAGKPTAAHITEEVADLVCKADLICYPIGSFYTSVVANLLPGGVGKAIVNARCPKIYLPNLGEDPEQRGMSLVDALEAIARYVRQDVGEELSLRQIVDVVLLDPGRADKLTPGERARLGELQVEIIATPICHATDFDKHDPVRVVEALVSLA